MSSCPLSQWCHLTISSSVVLFSSCHQSLPASGSFPMSQLFAWGGQSIGVSASDQSSWRQVAKILIQYLHSTRRFIHVFSANQHYLLNQILKTTLLSNHYIHFLVAQMVKSLPAIRKIWVRSLGWEDHLEKEMATHSSILAWKIPWMEEPGRLQSMQSQRVEYDWVTSIHFYWGVSRMSKEIK